MMECRPDCGACCIAPSISSPIPGMPDGKPAGVRCIQLGADQTCKLYGRAGRPEVCTSLSPEKEMCGDSRGEAMAKLTQMELCTSPPGELQIVSWKAHRCQENSKAERSG